MSTPARGRAAACNAASLDLLGAVLDLRGLVVDRTHRPGGPRTARDAVDRVLDQLATVDALLADQPDRTTR